MVPEEEGFTEVAPRDARANTVGGGSRGSLEIQRDLKEPWCYCMIQNVHLICKQTPIRKHVKKLFFLFCFNLFFLPT